MAMKNSNGTIGNRTSGL